MAAIAYTYQGALQHPASGDMYLTPNTTYASAANDIFIAHIAIDDNSTFTPPVDWSLIASTTNGAGQKMMTFWFRATGDHRGDTFTFTRVGGGQAIGIITQYRNCKTSGSPIDTYSVKANGSSATIDADSISPSVANCMILFAVTTLGGSVSGPSGTNPSFSTRYDNYWGNNDFGLASGIRTTADATGARTYNSAIAGISIGSLIALAPDVVAPPTAPTLLTAACSLPAVTVASFSTSVSQGDAPLTVVCTDASSYTPTSWAWRCGDGQTSTSQNPTFVLATPGIYDIELTATNAQGSDTIVKKILVTDPADPTIDTALPVAFFTTSAALIAPGGSVDFTDASSGTISTRAWTFGDGGVSAATDPSHTFAAAGQFIVTLVVTDSKGFQSTAVQVITVSNDPNPSDNPPTATITPNHYSAAAPGEIVFTSGASTPDVFYAWDFGDGSTSTEQSPTHEFIEAGTYTVSLTVTNVYGSSTSSIQIVMMGFLALGVSNTKYYVLDKQNDRVIVYGPTRAFVKSFGSRGTTAGKLKDPTQLLVSRAFMEVE